MTKAIIIRVAPDFLSSFVVTSRFSLGALLLSIELSTHLSRSNISIPTYSGFDEVDSKDASSKDASSGSHRRQFWHRPRSRANSCQAYI